MYTATDIENLSEALVESIDTGLLQELTRLCIGVFNPSISGYSSTLWQKPTACGGWFAQEQGCGNPFSTQCGLTTFTDTDCINQGKFDWGKCKASSDYSGNPNPQQVDITTPAGNHCTNNFNCLETKPFACAKDSGGNVFQCDAGEFECRGIFNCYSGYTCPIQYSCEATFGCADPHQCQSTFTCKESHTCGEGEMGLDSFRCDEALGHFDCGYEENDVQQGSFTCRDQHVCPGIFTCHLSNDCGSTASPDRTNFDCGTEGLSQTKFDCLTNHNCWDSFDCLTSHTCGTETGGNAFTCGNGGDVDDFKCTANFTCADEFNCNDKFDCPDLFTCGSGDQDDLFTCGTGEDWDRFTCGDGDIADQFVCTSTANYGCKGADPLHSAFLCGQHEQVFECMTYVCHGQGGSNNYNCMGQFNCRQRFECGDEQGSTFNCGTGDAGDSFTCGAPEPGRKPSKDTEYVCHTATAFSCTIGYHCPAPHRGYNCSGGYHCGISQGGSGTVYHCSNYDCPDPNEFECNADSEATFTCTGTIGQGILCSGSGGFVCHQRFNCVGLPGTPVQWACPSGSNFDCAIAHGFVCEGFYWCPQGYICSSMFICNAEPFLCGISVACNESTNFDCQIGFTCVHDSFQCPGTYVCNAGAFGCDGVNDQGQGNERFACAEDSGSFNCDASTYDFTCGFYNQSDFRCESNEFKCESQHMFTCGTPGQSTSYTCNTFTCRPQGVCNPRESYSCGGNPIFNLPGDFSCSQQHTCSQRVLCDGSSGGVGGDFACGSPGAIHFNCTTFQCGGLQPPYQCGTSTACFTASGIGHYCIGGGFNCPPVIGTEVSCSDTDSFKCPASQTHPYECYSRYNCGVGQNSHNCSGEDQVFICRLPSGFECGQIFFVSAPSGQAYTKAEIGSARLDSESTLMQIAKAVENRSQISPGEAVQLICERISQQLGTSFAYDPNATLPDLGLDPVQFYSKIGYCGLLS